MKRTFLLLVAALTALQAFAQEEAVSGEILRFVRTERSLSTSGAAGALFSSTTGTDWSASLFGNVAALPFMENRFAIGLSYAMWTPSATRTMNVTAGAAVKAGKRVGITAGFVRDMYPSFDFNGKTVKPFDMCFGGGISVAVAPCFSIGANFKYCWEEILYRITAFSFDILAQYHGKDFNVAAGVLSLGPKVKPNEDDVKYSLPASVRLSADYVFRFGIMSLQPALSAEYYFSKHFAVAPGLQFGVKDYVFVRAGYRYANEGCVTPSHLALGISGGYVGVSLSATFLTANKELGNSFLIGLGYRF